MCPPFRVSDNWREYCKTQFLPVGIVNANYKNILKSLGLVSKLMQPFISMMQQHIFEYIWAWWKTSNNAQSFIFQPQLHFK